MNRSLSHLAGESMFIDKARINRGKSVSGEGANSFSIWPHG